MNDALTTSGRRVYGDRARCSLLDRPVGRHRSAWRAGGFSMMEMMVVIAIVAILALLALPSYQDKIIRDQIVEALPLADIATTRIAASWAATQSFPADNAAAGLPAADKIVNNYVSALLVRDGAIEMTFGNRANALIKGKVLALRPAIVEDAPVVPVTWVCGYAPAPGKMTVTSANNTSVPTGYLPMKCR